MDNVLIEPDEVNLCEGCPEEEPMPTQVTEQAAQIVEHERAQWRMHWRVDKFNGEVSAEQIMAGLVTPVETVEIEDNLLTTAGIGRLEDLLIGVAGQAFDATHSRIGVGNGSTAANVSDTDLAAASGTANRQFKLVSGVSRSGTTITWLATFATTQANFAWTEFGIDNGTSDGTTVVAILLNRRIISAGTKTSAQTWAATATLTIS